VRDRIPTILLLDDFHRLLIQFWLEGVGRVVGLALTGTDSVSRLPFGVESLLSGPVSGLVSGLISGSVSGLWLHFLLQNILRLLLYQLPPLLFPAFLIFEELIDCA